ncbi:beta-lactamase hydrolase domain-containing protein [Natronospira bacteriovora]|uniref:Sulfur transferase domain-containing protein n=1 Tax=Natronospira bacteriovora TaxID=3069753 RepID=A0ABU0W4X8_9GAMM|nr:sulfur transferase domain-containing protein [Natronospira sp. AB-CW4]MDQ2068818.1 sulfur transferase domain-containing protein [Natronospira sp. AB-CW4]
MRTLILALALIFVWLSPVGNPAEAGGTEMPDIPHKTQVDENTLIGGPPDQEQLREARDAGIRTVVDLRGVSEYGDWQPSDVVTSLGMLYIPIPVAGADGLTRPAIEAFDRAIAAAGDQPALYHCASGNRVGAMFALRSHLIEGAGLEESLRIGREHGLTGLEDQVREMIESGRIPDGR